MKPRRAGIALIGVVLALVILEAAIMGALFLATLEATTTRTLISRTRAALAAESALNAALAGWRPDTIAVLAVHDTIALAAGGTIDGATLHARVEHVAPGSFIVAGTGTVPAPAAPVTATAAALVRWFAPAAFVTAGSAALTTGGAAHLLAGAIVEGDSTAASCPPADSLARATFGPAAGITASHPGSIHVAAGAHLAGSPPTHFSPAATDSAAFTRLGPFDIAHLALQAGRSEAGSIALAPAAAGARCDTAAAWNWGAPASPGQPCHDYVPLVHAPADLTITGGTGQALLITVGDLTLQPAAEIHGLVVVLGDATVHGRIRGALLVRGNTAIHGEVRRDACALWRALTRPAALASPHRVNRRWRLPSY